MNLNDFHIKLTLAIKNCRKPQYAIAEEIGVNTNTITNWKNGKSMPDLEQLYKIALICDCTISFFFNEPELVGCTHIREMKELKAQISDLTKKLLASQKLVFKYQKKIGLI